MEGNLFNQAKNMSKKIFIFLSVLVGVVIVSGCGNKIKTDNQSNTNNQGIRKENNISASPAARSCQEEKVDLPNYGDPGKRLKNCFVEYPGEPSRQDKSYYIVEDICGQFKKEFMENMLQEKLSKIELPKISGIYNCTYYFDEKEYVTLKLEYLSAENREKENEIMNRKVEKNSGIPMDNAVVYWEDDAINAIYLILGSEKFISMRSSSKTAIANDKFINLASKIGEAIKNYK